MRRYPCLALLLLCMLGWSVDVSAQTSPLTPAQQLDQARLLISQSKWDEALAVCREVVGRREEDPLVAGFARVQIGRCLLGKKQPAEAEQELRAVETEYPNDGAAIRWSQVYLIESLGEQAKPEMAIQIGRTLIADQQTTSDQLARARMRLGRVLNKVAQPDEAERMLQSLEGISFNDDDGTRSWGTLTRGEIRITRNQPQAAIPLLKRAVTEAGTQPEPRNWARVRLMEASLHSWALDRVGEVFQAVFDDHAAGQANEQQLAWALFWKGKALTEQDKYQEAIEPLEMMAAVAGTTYPDLVYRAQFAMGEALRRDGKHAESLPRYLAAFNQAVGANLSGDDRDWARLQVGCALRQTDQRDRGIAWLRMGIEDPAKMSSLDRILAERLASFLTPAEAEAWQAYLLSPASSPDPAQPFVQAEFKANPPAASSAVVNSASIRNYWLGKLYLQQKRAQAAVAAFREADLTAETPGQSAAALDQLTEAYRRQVIEARRGKNVAAAQSAQQEAEQAARRAVETWMPVILDGSTSEAHSAIEAAVKVHARLQRSNQALATAQLVLATLGPDADPAKVAFAHYMRMQALFWNNEMAAAAEEAEYIDRTYSARPEAEIQEIWAAALIRASAYHARLGNPAAGRALLDQVEQRYPGKYVKWVAPFRELCERLIVADHAP